MTTVTQTPGPGAAALQALIEDVRRLQLRVGFFENAKYPDGTQVALVAAVQELGSAQRHIPPRPFIRPAISAGEQSSAQLLAQALRQGIESGAPVSDAFEMLGLKISGDIKRAITEVDSPPLAQSTIENRQRKMANGGAVGSLDKPLVETALMLNSLTHEVVER